MGWGGFDDRLPASKITVIMKHMFHPNELTGQPQAHADLEEDIKEECGKLGPVDKITIYEKNPEGVISVRCEGNLWSRPSLGLTNLMARVIAFKNPQES